MGMLLMGFKRKYFQYTSIFTSKRKGFLYLFFFFYLLFIILSIVIFCFLLMSAILCDRNFVSPFMSPFFNTFQFVLHQLTCFTLSQHLLHYFQDRFVEFEEWIKFFQKLGETTKTFQELPDFLKIFLHLHFLALDMHTSKSD